MPYQGMSVKDKRCFRSILTFCFHSSRASTRPFVTSNAKCENNFFEMLEILIFKYFKIFIDAEKDSWTSRSCRFIREFIQVRVLSLFV